MKSVLIYQTEEDFRSYVGYVQPIGWSEKMMGFKRDIIINIKEPREEKRSKNSHLEWGQFNFVEVGFILHKSGNSYSALLPTNYFLISSGPRLVALKRLNNLVRFLSWTPLLRILQALKIHMLLSRGPNDSYLKKFLHMNSLLTWTLFFWKRE